MPDAPDTLTRLEQCVRRRDWDGSVRLTALLKTEAPPATADAIGEHIRRIQNALATAQAARAGLIVSSIRLRAAARFTHGRHVFVTPPES